MNFNDVSLIIMAFSFSALMILTFKKIPHLAIMPEPVFLKEETKIKIKQKASEVFKNRVSSLEKTLQKLLSKTRILSLKAEKQLSDWITKLRNRSLERTKGLDSYWKEIKTSIKSKEKKK